MAQFEGFYNWVAKFLANQLDKLKIANPVVFILVQSTLGTLLTLFATDVINLPNVQFLVNLTADLATDTVVISLLGALMAIIGPRTTTLKNGIV